VWFVETETFDFYDLGAGLCPLAQFWDAVDARLLAVHCIRLPGEAAAASSSSSSGGGGVDGSEGISDVDDSHQQRMVPPPMRHKQPPVTLGRSCSLPPSTKASFCQTQSLSSKTLA
jgi:hypothetical protein